MWYIATLLISIISGYLFLKLRVPAGAIIGGMVGVALFSLLTDRAAAPAVLSPLVLCGMGSFIGLDVTKEDIISLKRLGAPVVLLLFSMTFFSLISSFVMHRWLHLDLVTALFACAPAGIVDVSIIAASFGGDMPVIALLQSIRVAIIVVIFPPIFAFLSKRKPNVSGPTAQPPHTKGPEKAVHTPSIQNAILTLTCGFSFGMLANFFGIPAGAMAFSMLSVAALNIMAPKRTYLPKLLQRIIQCFGGAVIGVRFTYASISTLGSSWPMVLLMIFGLIVISIFTGYALHLLFGWDLVTALFSSAPGGISDMAIISQDFNADKTRVAFMQLCRFVGLILIYPYIVLFCASRGIS